MSYYTVQGCIQIHSDLDPWILQKAMKLVRILVEITHVLLVYLPLIFIYSGFRIKIRRFKFMDLNPDLFLRISSQNISFRFG